MMRAVILAAITTLLLLPPGACADGMGNGVDPLQIRVPSGPSSVPNPGDLLKLNSEVIYPIDSDVPIRVLASPMGYVRVTPPEAGPLRIKGRFIDAPSRVETRTLTGKFIYFLEPIKNGNIEVLVVPTGAPKPDDTDVLRQLVAVDTGVGPPGPIPPEPPAPKPPSVLQSRLQAAFDKDIVTPSRALDLRALSASYRAANRLALDPTYATRAALVAANQKNTAATLGEVGQPATKLFNLRRAAGDYLNETVGTDDVALTPDLRQKYVTAYTTVADTLDQLK